jgi:excisionase family DNA binding protein
LTFTYRCSYNPWTESVNLYLMPEDNRPGPDQDALTVAQAAKALGVSQDALRKRIKRGTINYHKAEDGRVYVWMDAAKTGADTDQDTRTRTVPVEHLEDMRDQIRFLREELQRKDAILLSLTERIPELEAREPAAKEEPEPPRSWWRRFLFP